MIRIVSPVRPVSNRYAVRILLVGFIICAFALIGESNVQSQAYNPGTIQGRVTNADGSGIEGARINISPPGVPSHNVFTDANGYYSSSVQSGTVQVWTYTQTGRGIRHILSVEVMPGQTVTMDDFIWNPGYVEGRITNADGSGIEGARINMSPPGVPSHNVFTDANGYYSSDVQSGTVQVWTYTQTGRGIRHTLSVEVTPGQTVTMDDFIWNPGYIQGKVTNAAGSGIEGARINISPSGAPSHKVYTDANGYYSSDVQSGTVHVWVYMPTGEGICFSSVNVPPNATVTVGCGIDNLAPTASWGLTLTPEGLLALDGSDSYDKDGQIIDYRWNLVKRESGESYTLQGMVASLESILWGCYDGTLVIVDNGGLASSTPFQVCVPKCSRPEPTATAGTSLDGNNMLQLDGTLSSDPQGDPLTFSWHIEGEDAPRTGQITSVADLPVGNHQVTLTVSDGIHTGTDTMLLAIPEAAGGARPPIDKLQQQIRHIRDRISSYSTSSFDAPNDTAAENRRKALLNMLDKVSEHIGAVDYQAAIDQLHDLAAKSDGASPPDSPPDWIADDPSTGDTHEQQGIAQLVSALINDLKSLL